MARTPSHHSRRPAAQRHSLRQTINKIAALPLCLLLLSPLGTAYARRADTPAARPDQQNDRIAGTTQGAGDVLALEKGVPVERELAGGVVHSYRLTLAAHQLLRLVVDQRGVDVVVTLFAPDGKKLAEVDSPNGTQGPEPVTLVTEVSGDYRLDVQSLEKNAAAGRYEARIEELRAATAEDGERLAAAAAAERLNVQVMRLYGEGKIDEALPLAERELVLREKGLGAEHPAVGLSLNNLGRLYYDKGDYARSEQMYRRSLAVREKALGPEHPDVAIPLGVLASLHVKSGRYASAEPMFRRALAIKEKAFGPAHTELFELLNEYAALHSAKEDYVRAESLYLRALGIAEKAAGAEHPAVVKPLLGLAWAYVNGGSHARAEELLQRGLAIKERELGREHPEITMLLDPLAYSYQLKGDYVRAEQLFQRVLAIREKAYGPEHSIVAVALDSLALLYRDKGDYARAEARLLRSLAINEKLFGGENVAVAKNTNNLAMVYLYRGDSARAESLFRRSLAIVEKVLGAEHPGNASLLNNLAQLYSDRGEGERAEPLFRRALAMVEKAYGPEHIQLAAKLNNLARGLELKGDYAEAESLYRRSLAILEKTRGAKNPLAAQVLHGLASMFAAKGDVARAVSTQARVLDIHEHNLGLVLTTGSEEQKRLYLSTLTGSYYFTVWLHVSRAPADPLAARLSLATVLGRKGRALDAMSDQVAALRRRLDPQDRALLEQLSATRSRLSALALKPSDKIDPAEHRAEVVKLEEEEQRLEAAVSERSAEFRAQSRPVTVEAVRGALPAGAALVEFVSYRPLNLKSKTVAGRGGAPRYVAYVLPREGAPAWVELGEAAPIDVGIAELRRALSNPASKDVKEAARALDERVMRPVRKLLGDARRVFLSPDGALNLIPFGALLDEHGKYLVEGYSITYLTSGRDLLRLQAGAASKQGPLVFANPLFDAQAAADQSTQGAAAGAGQRRSVDLSQVRFAPLPGTAGEAQALGSILPGVKVLAEAQATEAALKQVSGPSVLHVATHGFFLPDQPPEADAVARGLGLTADGAPAAGARREENPLLRSGLALAGANRGQSGAGEDGVLTALEAAGLDLWGTKLVVLSACETGIGEVKNGDGVYGLRRALVLAGSESQVMSLWQVSDEATRDLMISYYKRLQAGEERTEALRAVQLEMLRGGRQVHTDQERGLSQELGGRARQSREHPFFWASFIQSGDWRSINSRPGVNK